MGSPIVPGKMVESEAADVSGLPDLSQILKAEFHAFKK